MNCDLLVTGATVLTMDDSWTIHEPGFVAVLEGKIVGVGPMADQRDWTAGRTLDVTGQLVMPGLVNTHTHVAMAAFRGALEDVENRLIKYIFPMEKALVSPDLVYHSSRFCLAEMALSGTTTFADMYYFEHDVARATDEVGLRALLGETIVDFPAPDAREPYGGLDYGRRFLTDWAHHPRIQPMLAPHATYTCGPEILRTVIRESERHGRRWMMHVAETVPETQRFVATHGSVVRYLAAEQALGPGLIATHMIFTDENDLDLLVENGVSVAHCPSSNAKSARPIAPIFRYLERGIPVGLATDGPLSGNHMDLWGVMNWFPKLQKVLTGRRDSFPAREALRMATRGGAEVLGLERQIGSLEIGKNADFIVVDTDDFGVQPVFDWYATAVYALGPHNVRHVVVDGNFVVFDRNLCRVDAGELKDKLRTVAEQCRSEIRKLSIAP